MHPIIPSIRKIGGNHRLFLKQVILYFNLQKSILIKYNGHLNHILF